MTFKQTKQRQKSSSVRLWHFLHVHLQLTGKEVICGSYFEIFHGTYILNS